MKRRERGNGMSCDNCHRSGILLAPMLHDSVWQQFADERESLCVRCMFERANARKGYIGLSSLRPCAFNLFHWPHSFFNLFAKRETPPTRVAPEWHEAWTDLKGTKIKVHVGGCMRIVDRDLWFDVHQLTDHYCAEGLTGKALYVAIEEALPQRLAQELAKGMSTSDTLDLI
jgi:hypothetical protein